MINVDDLLRASERDAEVVKQYLVRMDEEEVCIYFYFIKYHSIYLGAVFCWIKKAGEINVDFFFFCN